MKSRIVAGQHSLSLCEEKKLYKLADTQLEDKIRETLPVLVSAHLSQFSELQSEIKLFNSLLWIYIQRKGVLERVADNVRLLLWVQYRISSINAFAAKLGLNPSFVGGLLGGEEAKLGGWNLANLMRICGVLKVSPEVLLFADLAAAVRAVSGTK